MLKVSCRIDGLPTIHQDVKTQMHICLLHAFQLCCPSTQRIPLPPVRLVWSRRGRRAPRSRLPLGIERAARAPSNPSTSNGHRQTQFTLQISSLPRIHLISSHVDILFMQNRIHFHWDVNLASKCRISAGVMELVFNRPSMLRWFCASLGRIHLMQKPESCPSRTLRILDPTSQASIPCPAYHHTWQHRMFVDTQGEIEAEEIMERQASTSTVSSFGHFPVQMKQMQGSSQFLSTLQLVGTVRQQVQEHVATDDN